MEVNKSDETFAQETLKLIERMGVRVERSFKENGKFETLFNVLGTAIYYQIEAKITKIPQVYILDDPRHYSGPGTSRLAIEEYDRAEKVQRWEKKEKTVTIKATGLPGLGTYGATYVYNPEGYQYDIVRKIERILDFLTERIRSAKTEAVEVAEEAKILQIKNAFAKV